MRVVFVGRERPIWKGVVLYIVTLGIYRRVWLYRVNKEIDGHAALGLNHGLTIFLLVLPIIGPSIVTYQTAHRCNHHLRTDIPLAYGPTPALYFATWVPILGNAFFLAWTQDRLNKYWTRERGNRKHGIDIDLDLDQDKRFLVELAKAQEMSHVAGSRFDQRKDARRDRWTRRRAGLDEAREERSRVRAAGGSTPLLPWRRPHRAQPRMLRITCGRCDQKFAVRQDPFAETPLLCPRCGLNEVLPSLRGDGLREHDRAVVAALEVDCPQCDTHFHALRDLYDKTVVECYNCGKKETLPAVKAVTAKAS